MRLRPEQLEQHLRGSLASVYVLFGDEPLLVLEAADRLRQQARQAGFDDREILTVEPGFDWGQLRQLSQSISLFASQRLLELRLQEAKPGDAGGKQLREYAADPPPDTLLLITAGRLDQASQNSAWFKALDKAGVVIQFWPVTPQQLPTWIQQRLRVRQLQPDRDVVQWLAERVEGNLLAAAQEIDRLALLHGPGALRRQHLEGVGDNARFDVFALVDSALAAKPARVSRILQVLQAEGVDPTLCCWALHRELRVLARLAREPTPTDSLFQRLGVRERRKPLVRAALKRLNSSACNTLLRGCARLDRLIKGQIPGTSPWEEMLHLCLFLAGAAIPSTLLDQEDHL